MPTTITIVVFKAFDKENKECFFDKTPEQIHEALNEICNTYVAQAIFQTTNFEFLPLNTLTKFITDANNH